MPAVITSTPSVGTPKAELPRVIPTPSFFATYAIDQAVCGLSAGIISTLCMHPLDLIKVQFQVSTVPSPLLLDKGKGRALSPPDLQAQARVKAGLGKQMWMSWKEIVRQDGAKGLYRGLSPNLLGNASSWGLYFLWYTMIKDRMNGGDSTVKLSAGQHLLASAQSGAITAVMTNPIWVVKTRMFTTSASSPQAYSNVWDGLAKLATQEGFRGLTKGMVLALFGVSNGAIQFMTYEELKKWRTETRRNRMGGKISEKEAKNLSNVEYILMSGSAKAVAIGLTYPYQVIRSRIQYQSATVAPYSSIPNCISRTYASEGVLGFYKGLGTNAVRILPGTCVTFVVYEQLSRFLAGRASSTGSERD